MNLLTVGSLFAGVVVAFGFLVLVMAGSLNRLRLTWWKAGLVALAFIVLSALPMLWSPYSTWRDNGKVREAQAAFDGWFAGANPGVTIPVIGTLQHPDTWYYVYVVNGKTNSVLRVNQQWLVLTAPAATPTP